MIALINHTAGADQALFHLVNGAWTTPLLDRVMPLLSEVGNFGAVWFAILGALAAFGKTTGRKVALAGLAAFAIGFAGAEVLKEIVVRPRPFVVFPDVRLLIPEPNSFAFPSGHTTSSFAVVSGTVLAARRLLGKIPLWGWPMLALAAAISYSRVYVGVHWPSDVAAGALFGVFSSWLGAKFRLQVAPRLGRLLKQRKANGLHEPGNIAAATPPVEYAMNGSQREEP